MRFVTRKIIAGIVCAVSIVAFNVAANAQPVTLRFAYTTQPDGPGGKAVQRMVDVVTQATQGNVAFQVFPNGQLGGDVELTSAIRSGNVDVAIVGTGAASTAVAPRLGVTTLPFIWKSRAEFWRVVRGPIGDGLLGELDSKGIKGLAWGNFGERGIITNGFEIQRLKDLAGRKIRVTQSQLYLKTMQAVGASPVPMPYADVYTALQQRAVDGVDTSLWAMVEAKFYEVASSAAITNHQIDSALILMNKKAFDSLRQDYQKAIIEGARAGGQTMFEEISKTTDSAVDVMKKKGLKITYPDPVEFEKAVQPVYAFFADQIGQQLIDQVKAAQK